VDSSRKCKDPQDLRRTAEVITTPRMEDAVVPKTEFNGICGPANYIRIVPICAAPSELGNGRFIGHARDRCRYRRCRRSNCACSGMFTLGAKSKELTLFYRATWEHIMRKFHSIATQRGDGLRPELRALFDRLAIDPGPVFFVRDGMMQAGPDPASETAPTNVAPLRVNKRTTVTPPPRGRSTA
jgi:hypothetical protein